jgi:hypothetical protein
MMYLKMRGRSRERKTERMKESKNGKKQERGSEKNKYITIITVESDM